MKRSKITQLPPEIRKWLDKVLAEKNFSDYQLLEEELKKRGFSIGKSSIHRYGSNLERRLAAIKASTHAAAMIAEAAPDDAGQRSAAVMGMLETEIFELLVGMQDVEAEDDPLKRAKLLSALAGNIAKLSRASVNQKKHELEVRDKVKAAAAAAEKIGRKGGLSKGAVDEIRREILGIAA